MFILLFYRRIKNCISASLSAGPLGFPGDPPVWKPEYFPHSPCQIFVRGLSIILKVYASTGIRTLVAFVKGGPPTTEPTRHWLILCWFIPTLLHSNFNLKPNPKTDPDPKPKPNPKSLTRTRGGPSILKVANENMARWMRKRILARCGALQRGRVCGEGSDTIGRCVWRVSEG